MAEDFYKTLGVAKTASDDEIKSSYKKLAMKYHPDLNKNSKDAEVKFKEINRAYDTLKDPQKRANYDRFGTENGGSPFGSAGSAQHGQGFGFGDISDLFEEMFGNFSSSRSGASSGRRAKRRGADLRYDLHISLEDALKGIEKKITVSALGQCESCNGKGSNSPSSVENCKTCSGTGRTTNRRGFFVSESVCNKCSGYGYSFKSPCKTCNGSGTSHSTKALNVSIPKGVDTGMKIRLSGKGEASPRGGEAGDLYIVIFIQKHKDFDLKDKSLYKKITINMVDAALGTVKSIPTIDGTSIDLSIPAGTQSGQSFRIKEKGMLLGVNSRKRADMYVKVIVETPKNLTGKQKQILKDFYNTKGSAGIKRDLNNTKKPRFFNFFNKQKDLAWNLK